MLFADTSRRACLQLASAGLLGAASAACAAGRQERDQIQAQSGSGRLIFRPRRIIKATDLAREGTQTWFVALIVEAETPSVAPIEMLECVYLSGSDVIRTDRYSAAGLAPLALPIAQPSANTQPQVYRPFAFRLICRAHGPSNVNRMECSLRLTDGSVFRADVPIDESYEQRTALVFPFRGPGLIVQAGAANGGHRNTSGLFALDALGLAPNYGPQRSTASDVPDDYAGFGRQLIAPGGGVVVSARGDRLDQPRAGEVSEAYLLAEDPAGDPGNHLIIDHENGEFSMIAHLQAGSLSVAAGDRLTQGQPIGRLGNSGNSFGPHVHYQLQDGPDRNTAAGLPCAFANVSATPLDRGAFFTAR
jgi:hypothetical protein